MWILAQLLTEITRRPRYKVVAGVDFQWSPSCWVHNIFRIYELLFYSRKGIRVGGVKNILTGETYSYTWENLFAVWEGALRLAIKRKLPKFKIVYIPQLQLAGMARGGVSPFRFAIAFDNVNPANYTFHAGNTTYTGTLTTTGSNITVLLQGITNNTGGVAVSSGAFNGSAASSGTSNVLGNETVYVWFVPSAATGTNLTTSITAAADAGVGIEAISLTGTDSSPKGAVNGANGTVVQTGSVAVNTTAANSWVTNQLYLNNKATSVTATGSGQTARGTDIGDAGFVSTASTQTTTSTGSYTSTWTWVTNSTWQMASMEVKELAGAVIATTPSRLSLLGIS